jgi:hypothetical protein
MKRFFFFLMLLVPFFSIAQSNFRPGYVITNTGDSIPGFINYKERAQNAASFEFKTSVNASTQPYHIDDCKAYGLNGIESYERFTVNVSLNKVDITNLPFALDTTSVRDTVFLRVIQKGKNLSLFSYTDEIKTRFYVKEPDQAAPIELIFSTYFINEGGKTANYDKYMRQLNALMVKNNVSAGQNQIRLRTLKYSKAPILAIVSQINDKKVEKGLKSARLFLGAGLNSSKASYSGKTVFNGPGVRTKTSYAPMITAGIDLFSNPNIGRIIYRAELSFTPAKSEIYAPNTDPTLEYKTHTFKSYSVSITPQVIWNLYNSNPLKFFIGAGAAINVASYKDNVLTTKTKFTEAPRVEIDKIELNGFYLAPQVSAGIVLKKKIEVFGNYQFNSAITDYSAFNVCMVRLNAGVKYLFGH